MKSTRIIPVQGYVHSMLGQRIYLAQSQFEAWDERLSINEARYHNRSDRYQATR